MGKHHMSAEMHHRRLQLALSLIHKWVDKKAFINANGTGIKYSIYDGKTLVWLPLLDADRNPVLTRQGTELHTPQRSRVNMFLSAGQAFRILEELGMQHVAPVR